MLNNDVFLVRTSALAVRRLTALVLALACVLTRACVLALACMLALVCVLAAAGALQRVAFGADLPSAATTPPRNTQVAAAPVDEAQPPEPQAAPDERTGAPRPLAIERGVRQLFLDDVGIASLQGVRRVLVQPRRHPANPLVVADQPWEGRCQVYGTALWDEEAGLFKLWYLTTPTPRGLEPLVMPDGRRLAPHVTLAAYAFSRDGVRWAKPTLEQFSFDGDTRNNLLDLGRYNCEGLSVLYDPRDPDPARRWKAAYWDHGSGGFTVRDGKPHSEDGPHDGFSVAFSADGLVWNPSPHNPVLRTYCDTNQNVVYDPRLERYVAYSRFHMGRRIARSESADFEHWSPPQLVLECDHEDGPGTQYYGAGIDLYEGVYIAMLWIYREGGDATIDTQLATSRDGIHWVRVADRGTWLELGESDSWEGGMVRSVERIITRGEELYVYYCGVHGAHGRPGHPEVVRQHLPAIGLVTLRRDGFVALQAGDHSGGDLPHAENGTPSDAPASGPPDRQLPAAHGEVLTVPLVVPEGTLHVNVDASGGELVVVACDAAGAPLAGFSASRPIRGDRTAAAVEWSSSASETGEGVPASLAGQTVRLRFMLREARLFSYWWE